MLAIFFGTIVGILLFLGIAILIIYVKIKKTARNVGLGSINFKDVANFCNGIMEEESKKSKTISGMTNLLLPSIRRDFPEFNENLLFNMTEESLRTIFDSLNNKDKTELEELPLIKDNVSIMIDDYIENNIDVNYSDVIFHEFAIKDYNKISGVATITVTTSVEYYYSKKVADKSENESRYKKQTRYSCKFIYIYDESLVKDELKVLSTNCPNCGAVIKRLGHKNCEYCGTAIKEVNLKAWAFSSYQEY